MKKQNVPPVPAHSHRRSKSEGKIIFGEEDVDMRKRLNTTINLPGMVSTGKEVDNRIRKPPPPPKPSTVPANSPSSEPLEKDLPGTKEPLSKRTASGPQDSPKKQSTVEIKDSPEKHPTEGSKDAPSTNVTEPDR